MRNWGADLYRGDAVSFPKRASSKASGTSLIYYVVFHKSFRLHELKFFRSQPLAVFRLAESPN
jgi:hypothetical protein